MQDKTTLDLIDQIYDCALDASRWPSFLEAAMAAIGATRGTLTIRNPRRDEFVAVCWRGWTDEDVALYARKYAAFDVWSTYAVRWAEGEVGADYDLCPRKETEASVVYREFYVPRDGGHGLGAKILQTETGQSLLCCVRGEASGPFGEAEKDVLRPLMPHLKRAALLQGELGWLRRQIAPFTGHLDRLPQALLLADMEMGVLYANRAARNLTSIHDGLTVENDRFVVGSARLQSALREAAGRMLRGEGPPLRSFEIQRPSGRPPYRLVLMSVEDSRTVPLGVAVPAVTVLIADSEFPSGPDPAVLCELFSLTPKEGQVAAMLALGRSVEEIAEQSGTALETVRTHLKRILSKTGTGRQGELISRILRSVPLVAPETGAERDTPFG